jgi:hypothetical protein
MYTILSSIMQRYTTQDEVMAEFTQKLADLAKQGWVPYGDIMYYVNGVSQAMIMGDQDVSDLKRVFLHGSTRDPGHFQHCIGGEGFMGKYVDITSAE